MTHTVRHQFWGIFWLSKSQIERERERETGQVRDRGCTSECYSGIFGQKKPSSLLGQWMESCGKEYAGSTTVCVCVWIVFGYPPEENCLFLARFVLKCCTWVNVDVLMVSFTGKKRRRNWETEIRKYSNIEYIKKKQPTWTKQTENNLFSKLEKNQC